MKHLVVKDRNLRKGLKKLDKKNFLFKYLKRKNLDASRFNNRCVLSYREKSVLRLFRHSRIVNRNLSLNGDYPGVVKSSW